MSTRPPSFLYDLLPIVLRRRDTTRGRHTLRAVTGVAQSVFELLEDDIGALYDNWFVETCDDWVLPYLADLLAIPPLLSAQRPAVDLRRLVANVVEYRRSKGTPQTLADVSRDVLGWPVRILESKAIVARTPHVGAFDSTAPASLNVADVSGEIELGSAFERAARTLDVRGLGARASGLAARGVQRPGTPREIALSVWRAQPMSLWLVDSAAVNGKPNCYTFDPLGHDRRLVNPPSYAADSPPERAVPAPLRNDVLHEELRGRIPPTYFSGDPVAFTIEIERANGVRTALSTDEIAATALGTWKRPVAGRALVDVERGRFVLDPAWKNPRATFTWGTGGDIGGGPYRTGVDTSADPDHDVVVTRDPSTAANTFSSLAGAFAAAAELSGHVRITIQDNGTYDMPKTLALTANLVRVDLRAWDGPRPLVRGDVTIDVATPGAHVVLDGIVLDGTVTIDASAPHFRLELQDATLVPLRQPSVLSAAMLLDAHVLLRRSICGRVVLPELGTRLDASESILDGAGANAIEGPRATAGPETTLRECTVLGGVHAYAADVRGSIVEGALTVEAGDASSAGHSMIRRVDGFDVPRSVRAVRTRFVSRRYGTDGYGRLPLDADPLLLGGASNGEELGAFHAAATGRRLANVRTVLDEYVPYGIVAGVIDEG